MSIIDISGRKHYERKLVNNYAAEYAKRECDEIKIGFAQHKSAETLAHPDGCVTTEKLADYCVTTDKIDDMLMETIDMSIDTANSACMMAKSANNTAKSAANEAQAAKSAAEEAKGLAKSAETAANEAKTSSEAARITAEEARTASEAEITLDRLADEVKTEFAVKAASTSRLGGIKLLASGSGGNRSGLVVSSDGTAYVNTRSDRGVTRDGSGQICINPATESEIDTGTDAYKPITANTLARFMNYSKTVKRVGTWIDGTPIWRMAVDFNLTSAQKSSISEYGIFSYEPPFVDRTAGGIILVDECIQAYLPSSGGKISHIDCTQCECGGGFEWKVDKNLVENGGYTRIVGWIEFTAAESNLSR